MEKEKGSVFMAANTFTTYPDLIKANDLNNILDEITPKDSLYFGGGSDGPAIWGNGIPRGKILDKKTHKLRDMTNKEKAKKFLKEAVEGANPDTISGMAWDGANLTSSGINIFKHQGFSSTVSTSGTP